MVATLTGKFKNYIRRAFIEGLKMFVSFLSKVQNYIRRAFNEANSEITSSKDNDATKSLSMDSIAGADSLFFPIVDLK